MLVDQIPDRDAEEGNEELRVVTHGDAHLRETEKYGVRTAHTFDHSQSFSRFMCDCVHHGVGSPCRLS